MRAANMTVKPEKVLDYKELAKKVQSEAAVLDSIKQSR